MEKPLRNFVNYLTLIIGTAVILLDVYWNLPMRTPVDIFYFTALGLTGASMVYLSAAELFTFFPKFVADQKGMKFPDKTFLKWEDVRHIRFEQRTGSNLGTRHFMIVSLVSNAAPYSWDMSRQRFNPIEVITEVEAVLPARVTLEKVEVTV